MAELREVQILIGRRNYRMQTTLDEPALERITSLIAEVGTDLNIGVDHDNLLMLTTLHMAYALDKIQQRLLPLKERLQNMESPDPKA